MKGEDLSEWTELIDQKRNQSYDGERHQFETGILLLRIGEIDRGDGSWMVPTK